MMNEPSKEEMIKKIYEVIADKTLSFGCKVKMNNGNIIYVLSIGERYGKKVFYWDIYNFGNDDCASYTEVDEEDHYDKIIGHPVYIGDVLDWIEKNNQKLFEGNGFWWTINHCFYGLKRQDKRKSIDDQSDYCITFIYSLIHND